MSGGLTLTKISNSLTKFQDRLGAFVAPVIPKVFRRFWSDATNNSERFYSKGQHGGQDFYSQMRIEV